MAVCIQLVCEKTDNSFACLWYVLIHIYIYPLCHAPLLLIHYKSAYSPNVLIGPNMFLYCSTDQVQAGFQHSGFYRANPEWSNRTIPAGRSLTAQLTNKTVAGSEERVIFVGSLTKGIGWSSEVEWGKRSNGAGGGSFPTTITRAVNTDTLHFAYLFLLSETVPPVPRRWKALG